ncbi:BBE domain-containing protein [Janthinobacterium sp. B9-8]|nr:BBE domain-containing protein [Janthinobacterium sp. B9-8]
MSNVRPDPRALYFLDNFRKGQRNLVQVKQQWDPQNFFHHAQSIPVK